MPEKKPRRRSYQQYCAMARALDVVGERWTLLIIRNLLLGPRRYTDLLDELPGITTNLLAKRLRELEQASLIVREERPPPVPATVYRLSPTGAALEPVVMELGRWGGRYMAEPRPRDTVNIGWGLLSLKRRYRGGLRAEVEFRVGPRSFALTFSSDTLRVEERPSENAELSVGGELPAFQAWLFRGVAASELEAQGALRICGDSALVARLAAALGLS